MGNCVHRCFGVIDRRKRYFQSKYSNVQDFSIEFENLMGEEPQDEMTRLLTDREQQLLSQKQFATLAEEQHRIDVEIDAKLAHQEEELEREEEEFYEAKRQAARIAKLNKQKEETAKNNLASHKGGNPWAKGNDEWETAGGEDDFEMFLASVKARSLATRSQVKNGSGDGHSSSSSNTHTKDRSLTEGSSLDMEWEHEAGMSPHRKPAKVSVSEDNCSKTSTASPMHSSDLEWDPEFVSAEDNELHHLLNSKTKSSSGAHR